MIKTEFFGDCNFKTVATFGNGDIGVGYCNNSEKEVSIFMSNLKDKSNIGSLRSIYMGDNDEKKLIEFKFDKIESIDVVINSLFRCRELLFNNK